MISIFYFNFFYRKDGTHFDNCLGGVLKSGSEYDSECLSFSIAKPGSSNEKEWSYGMRSTWNAVMGRIDSTMRKSKE